MKTKRNIIALFTLCTALSITGCAGQETSKTENTQNTAAVSASESSADDSNAALDDLYQYIDADIEYMYNNATMVITSPDKILEIVSGQNVAYLNDKPYNMPVPILSFEDTVYMSVEFFAQEYDISYRYIESHDFVVLYSNLVQLKNPSVPNQLSKE